MAPLLVYLLCYLIRFNINKDTAYVIAGSSWHFIQTAVDTRLQNSAIENPFRKKVLMRNFMPYISGPNGIRVRRKKVLHGRTLSFQVHEKSFHKSVKEKKWCSDTLQWREEAFAGFVEREFITDGAVQIFWTHTFEYIWSADFKLCYFIGDNIWHYLLRQLKATLDATSITHLNLQTELPAVEVHFG